MKTQEKDQPESRQNEVDSYLTKLKTTTTDSYGIWHYSINHLEETLESNCFSSDIGLSTPLIDIFPDYQPGDNIFPDLIDELEEWVSGSHIRFTKRTIE